MTQTPPSSHSISTDPASGSTEDFHRRLLALIEDSGQVYFSLDLLPELRINYLSPSIQQLSGYSPTEISQNPNLAVGILDPYDFYQGMTSLAQAPLDTLNGLFRLRRKDGVVVGVHVAYRPIYGDGGAVEAMDGMVWTDGQGQWPSPAQTGDQSILANLIETAIDAVIVLDSRTNILVFNSAAERMFQCSAREAIGQPIGNYLSDPVTLARITEETRRPSAGSESSWTEQPRVATGSRCDGVEFPIEISLSAFKSGGELIFSAIIRDITDRKQMEDELRHLSTHDGLTGLYNRFFFQTELNRLEKGREESISVVIADVDGLKYVNDTFGHAAGDDLLVTVARAIQSAFRAGDVIARLGGDEFGVILPGADTGVTSAAVSRIYDYLQRANLDHADNPISMSIGYATVSNHEAISETVKRADANMYVQKHRRTSPPRL